MSAFSKKAHRNDEPHEVGATVKSWQNRIHIAIIYPNAYAVGMPNLGFQSVYQLFNDYDEILCERFFLPDTACSRSEMFSIESRRPLLDFHIIAFSISFESDFLHVLTILNLANIPLLSDQRDERFPIVIAGGVACFLNPEPISYFMDCFLIGDAEVIIPHFVKIYDPFCEKDAVLKKIMDVVPGAYVPKFFGDTREHKVRVAIASDINTFSTCTRIMSPDSSFGEAFLIELSRGCSHGCRFCSAGFIYRPPRIRQLETIKKQLLFGSTQCNRIGLMSASVSDYPEIKELLDFSEQNGLDNTVFTFSSFRADAISERWVSLFKKSNLKTATIAPEAGSERLRQVINKGITEQNILEAVRYIIEAGIPNIRLYFMVGLPTETSADIDELIELTQKIKDQFLSASRKNHRIGVITLSISPFVPKPFTPFQWVAMTPPNIIKQRIATIRDALRSVPNMKIYSDSARNHVFQTLCARGDKTTGDFLMLAFKNHGNWTKTIKQIPAHLLEPSLYPTHIQEYLPWNFIIHHVSQSFLLEEYEKSLKGTPSAPCPILPCDMCKRCSNE
ncbi:MAG: radical SAM protein [Desulfobacterales bacterium]|nr:radical SAM protein [Desulfobacterales bacterium]